MRPIIDKSKDWWREADRTQKIVTLGGGGLLALVAAGAFWIASRPKMAPVYPGAAAPDQGRVREALTAMGFPAEVNPNTGDVMAPADKIPEIKMQLELEGKAPTPSARGMDWLSQTSPFTSPNQERERIKAAKEGELAASIETMASIETARVHINFGKESPFAAEGAPPTAVINVSERGGRELTAEEAKAIARLVQNSVPGLGPAGVTVVTASGRIAYDGQEIETGSAEGTRKIEMEREEGQRRERDLQRRLDQAFGAGNTIATVAVELDLDEVKTETEAESPTRQPLARATMTESMSGPGAGQSGDTSGVSANLPEAAGEASGAGSQGSDYSSEVRQEEFGRSLEKTFAVRAPGTVKTLTVNVLVNSDKIADPQPVRGFVDGLLAAKGQRDFRATVTGAPFSKDAEQAAAAAKQEAFLQQVVQQIVALLPAAALFILAFIIIRTLRGSKAQTAEAALPGGGSMPFPVGPEDGAAPAGLPWPQQEGTAPAFDSPLLAQAQAQQQAALIQAQALQAPVQDGGSAAAALAAMAGAAGAAKPEDEDSYWVFEEDEDGEVTFKEIKEKVDVPLEQIRTLAKTRPDTVAQLLKSWLMEDR